MGRIRPSVTDIHAGQLEPSLDRFRPSLGRVRLSWDRCLSILGIFRSWMDTPGPTMLGALSESTGGVAWEHPEVWNEGRCEIRSVLEALCCTGTTLVLHGYCTGTALILHWYCTGATQALHQYCDGTALVLWPYYTGNALARQWPYTSTAHVLQWCHAGSAVPVSHQCGANAVRMHCQWFTCVMPMQYPCNPPCGTNAVRYNRECSASAMPI